MSVCPSLCLSASRSSSLCRCLCLCLCLSLSVWLAGCLSLAVWLAGWPAASFSLSLSLSLPACEQPGRPGESATTRGTDRQTDGQTSRQTDSQPDSNPANQQDRQPGRQIDRETEIERETTNTTVVRKRFCDPWPKEWQNMGPKNGPIHGHQNDKRSQFPSQKPVRILGPRFCSALTRFSKEAKPWMRPSPRAPFNEASARERIRGLLWARCRLFKSNQKKY